MQAPRADVLNAFEKSELLASARDLLDDTLVRSSITLRGVTDLSVDLETGIVTPTSNSDTVNALRRTVDEVEAARSEGAFLVGDRVYLVEQADLTNPLTKIDEVVDGSDVYEVVRWHADPLDWLYQIVARRT